MRVLRTVLWCVLFFYIVIIFLPKENFYFLAEHKLNEYKVTISNESLKDLFGIFTVKGSHVSYYGDEAAQIDTITLLPFILYNEVSFQNLHISKKFQSFVPSEISKASVKFTPFYPVKLWISLEGSFGEIYGSYNMYGKTARFVLKPQDDFRQKYPFIYGEFKDIDGELVYESSFK
jgi:hypothetical protein